MKSSVESVHRVMAPPAGPEGLDEAWRRRSDAQQADATDLPDLLRPRGERRARSAERKQRSQRFTPVHPTP